MKKLLTVLLSCLMVFMLFPISVFSYENKKEDEEERIKQSGGWKNYIQNKEHDKKYSHRKMSRSSGYLWGKNNFYSSGDSHYFINVPFFAQETDYYCGPAATKTALYMINGTSKSQKEYARMLGTDIDGKENPEGTYVYKIKEVLNKEQDVNDYGWREIGWDMDYFWHPIRTNINKNSPLPIIARIRTKHLSIYQGTVLTHYVTIHGRVEGPDKEVKYIDPFNTRKFPYLGYEFNPSGYRTAPAQEFLNGTTHLIW